jgi:hypothetical protein
VTQPDNARFSLGINYLPAGRFDPGKLREDVARMAELGFDAVRFFVPWDELQPGPGPDALDESAVERIAHVVEIAAAAGLRSLPTLAGALGGRDRMPAWAATLRDLYRGPLLDAQVRIAQAIAERVRERTAIVAWDIGHAFARGRPPRAGTVSAGEHASAPVAEHDVAEWARLLAKTVGAAGIAATAGIDDADLIDDTGIRLGSLCAGFAFASLQASNVRLPIATSRLDPEAVPFLAMLAAAFSFKPVLVTAVGNPTCPPGKFSPFERFARAGEPPAWSVSPDDPVFAGYPCLSEDENAAYATAVLERLHADGRLGAYWWCWADGDDDAPADQRSWGILRRDGSAKPVAAALAAFARQARPLRRPADMPMIASTYYYRTLPESTRTLYDAYLGDIAARRAER